MTDGANLPVDTPKAASSDIRVLIVGRQQLLLLALRALIQGEAGLSVVGLAHDSHDLDIAASKPDVILVDIVPGREGAIEVLGELVKVEGARILVLTDKDDPEFYLTAVRLGAMGVLNKMDSGDSFFQAIRSVHRGEIFLNPALVRQFLHGKPLQHVDPEAVKIAELTARERDVIALICEGRKNKQIAERLFISECTVRHHLTSIFDKLGLEDRVELLLYAYQHRLAQSPTAHRTYSTPRDDAALIRRLSRTA